MTFHRQSMELYEKSPFVIKHYHISICASFQSLPHASGSAFSFCPTYFASTVPYLSSYSNHQRFLVDLRHVFIENDLKNQSESRSRILNWWNSLEAPTLPFVKILGEGLGPFLMNSPDGSDQKRKGGQFEIGIERKKQSSIRRRRLRQRKHVRRGRTSEFLDQRRSCKMFMELVCRWLIIISRNYVIF